MKRVRLFGLLLLGWVWTSSASAFSLRPAITDVETIPGGEVRQRVELRNDRTTPMTIYATIQGVAPKNDGSGVDFLDPATAEAGKWFLSTGKEWVLGAGEVRPVDFLLRVPTSTKPGFYPVSIAFSEFYPANGAVSQAVRIASLWFINVKENATTSTMAALDDKGLFIKESRLVREQDGLWLETTVQNPSMFSRRLSGTIVIKRNADEETKSVDDLNVRVLPESERMLRIPLGRASFGRYIVRIQIDGAAQERVTRWFIPWLLIGSGGFVVILVAGALLRRRRA